MSEPTVSDERGPYRWGWQQRLGWALMSIPTGVRTPLPLLMRFGPYRWGAWLCNRRAWKSWRQTTHFGSREADDAR